MSFTHKIYAQLVHFLQQQFLAKEILSCETIHLDKYQNTSNRLDLATIAFNNPTVIEHQICLVRKYIQGNYNYIVADNSTDKAASQQIKQLCQNANVPYIRLPKNRLGIISASYSHAASLNWVYQKIIKLHRPTYFGFIDHDLFPIRPISIDEKLKTAPLYGKVVTRENLWYLWAGLCFFRFDFVENANVDFLPTTVEKIYLDSGGGNWNDIYSKFDSAQLPPCDVRLEQLREGDNYHSDFVQYMDDCWLHLINGSNWANQKPRNLSYLLQRDKTWVEKQPKDNELISSLLSKYK